MFAYERLLELAQREPSILGVVLSGSRGRGVGRSDSDWDCYAILAENAGADGRARLRGLMGDPTLDLTILTMAEFETYASPGSENAWEAYAFAHATIAVDQPEGDIANIAAAKELLPSNVAERIARTELDSYINAAVRSAKSRASGQTEEARLDSAESVAPALEALFACEGRVRPYNGLLEWELLRHPLLSSSPPSPVVELVGAAASGEPAASASLFNFVERTMRSAGFGDVFDAWDDRAIDAARGGSSIE